MPNKSERRKLRVFRRTAKQTRMFTKGKKHAKQLCVLCEKPLHGVLHGASRSIISKTSKSQRRPTKLLAGILCANCTKKIVVETAKVHAGMKNEKDVEISLRPYMAQVAKQVD